MDDLEAVIDAIKSKGSIDKKDFAEIVRGAIKERPMSPDEISLLFRVFDTNKDAVLELSGTWNDMKQNRILFVRFFIVQYKSTLTVCLHADLFHCAELVKLEENLEYEQDSMAHHTS